MAFAHDAAGFAHQGAPAAGPVIESFDIHIEPGEWPTLPPMVQDDTFTVKGIDFTVQRNGGASFPTTIKSDAGVGLSCINESSAQTVNGQAEATFQCDQIISDLGLTPWAHGEWMLYVAGQYDKIGDWDKGGDGWLSMANGILEPGVAWRGGAGSFWRFTGGTAKPMIQGFRSGQWDFPVRAIPATFQMMSVLMPHGACVAGVDDAGIALGTAPVMTTWPAARQTDFNWNPTSAQASATHAENPLSNGVPWSSAVYGYPKATVAGGDTGVTCTHLWVKGIRCALP